MPELPDVELYCHALRPRVVGNVLERIRLASPFVLRSVEPSIDAVQGGLAAVSLNQGQDR